MPTKNVFLIEPVQFGYNAETAQNNAFQVKANTADDIIQKKAREEFIRLVDNLKRNGVAVTQFIDTVIPETPDSIFPNNWISTHADGTLFIYPMYAKNRRAEVRTDIIESLKQQFGFDDIIDWQNYAEQNIYLEGTGSLVLDRKNALAYCCISERSDATLAEEWGDEMGYEVLCFHAVDHKNQAIYHTNVLMAMADDYVVICLDSITDEEEQELILDAFHATNKEIVAITREQMNHFAGNMIELTNDEGESLLVMSQAAYDSLNQKQVTVLETYSKLIVTDIPTIEANGGGSVRCMIAEIYPKI